MDDFCQTNTLIHIQTWHYDPVSSTPSDRESFIIKTLRSPSLSCKLRSVAFKCAGKSQRCCHFNPSSLLHSQFTFTFSWTKCVWCRIRTQQTNQIQASILIFINSQVWWFSKTWLSVLLLYDVEILEVSITELLLPRGLLLSFPCYLWREKKRVSIIDPTG